LNTVNQLLRKLGTHPKYLHYMIVLTPKLWSQQLHTEQNNMYSKTCPRSVHVTCTVRVIKQHPVNINFLKKTSAAQSQILKTLSKSYKVEMDALNFIKQIMLMKVKRCRW